MKPSIEVRRNLISFLDGALFNGCRKMFGLFRENDEPGSDFQLDRFFNEIAIGTGFGLRIDFSFLIMRFCYLALNYTTQQEIHARGGR